MIDLTQPIYKHGCPGQFFPTRFGKVWFGEKLGVRFSGGRRDHHSYDTTRQLGRVKSGFCCCSGVAVYSHVKGQPNEIFYLHIFIIRICFGHRPTG